MILDDYRHFGGIHWESAALRNTLAYAGVVAPHTGQPLSEALCLVISGGIAAGYSFCPSIPGYDVGSGISVVGRYQAFRTDASTHAQPLERLGAKVEIHETGGAKGAAKKLEETLQNGRPAIVWSSPLSVVPERWAGCYGMYSTVVVGIEGDEALLADRAPGALRIGLDELSACRDRVCSHKNRLLSFEPPKKLSATALKKAVLEGVRACAADFAEPKLGTYNLPGLLDWSKMIANDSNKRGWGKVFPDGRLYRALRDTYDSIETAGTGGGLLRPLFADGLEEAAEITGRSALRAVADGYRELGAEWSALADAILPKRIPAFAKTRRLLRKRAELFQQRGEKARKQIERHTADLRALEEAALKDFPLDAPARAKLLQQAGERIATLHAHETDMAAMLARAAR